MFSNPWETYDLIDELNDHEQEDEDAEHLVLETLLGVITLEEGEADEKRAANGENRFRVDVRRGTPVLLGNAHADSRKLSHE